MPRLGLAPSSQDDSNKPRSRSLVYGTARAAMVDAPSRAHRALSWGMALSQTPLADRYRKYHMTTAGHLGFWPTVCFIINLVVGSGFLGVPKAFYESGVLLGLGATLFCAVACDITKNFVLETMARAEAVTEFYLTSGTVKASKALAAATAAEGLSASRGPSRDGSDGPSVSTDLVTAPATRRPVVRPRASSLDKSVDAAATAVDPEAPLLVTKPDSPRSRARTASTAWRPQYRVTGRKFEITELCELFLGLWPKRGYLLCVCLFNGGAQWAYVSVFAASCSANIPIWFLNDGDTCDTDLNPDSCWGNFHVWLAVFGCIVIPLSCMELKETKVFQVIMAIARCAIILLMVFTSLGGIACDGVAFAGITDEHQSTRMFNLPGLRTLVPVVIYALIVHPGIPTLSQPSACRGPRLSDAFSTAYVGIVTCYVVSGVALAMYFGSAITAQANLHWEAYVGCVPGTPDSVTAADASIAAKVIRFIILLFPGLDVISAYALQATTLGNNLLSAWAGEQAPKADGMKRIRIFFRLLAAVPPVVGAFFVADLDKIMSVAGVIGFGVAFFFPVALFRVSGTRCAEVFGTELAGLGPAATPYRSRFYFPNVDLVIGAVFAVVAIYAFCNALIDVI